MDQDKTAQAQVMAIDILSDLLGQARELAARKGALLVSPSHLLSVLINHPDGSLALAAHGYDPERVAGILAAHMTASTDAPLDKLPGFEAELGDVITGAQIVLQTGTTGFFSAGIVRTVLDRLILAVEATASSDPACNEALASTGEHEMMDPAGDEPEALGAPEAVTPSAEDDGFSSEEIEAMLRGLEERHNPQERVNRGPSALRGPAGRDPNASPKPATNRSQEDTTPADAGGIAEEAAAAGTPPRPAPAQTLQARDAAEVQAAVKRSLRSLSDAAARGEIDPVIGREAEIGRVIRALLRRRKSSVLLHGEAGVGKTAIAEGLALALRAADAPEKLRDRPVFELSLAELVSGARYRGDFEERVMRALEKIKAENAIVFIDEVHALMGLGASQAKGMDAGNIIKPALARGELSLIGATTTEELSVLRQDKAIMRRFELVAISEPDRTLMEEILDRSAWPYLEHHGLTAGRGVMTALLDITDRQTERRYPDKAFELLDTACVEAVSLDAPALTADHIRDAARLTGLMLADAPSAKAMRRLSGVEKALAQEMPGQAAAVASLMDRLRPAELAPGAEEGSAAWIIDGPESSVTRLTEAFSAALGVPLVRFDQARLGDGMALPWLVGLPGSASQDYPGFLVRALEATPEAMIVFDGIDAAHPSVQYLVRQVIQTGVVRTGDGRPVSARRARIVLTTCLPAAPSPGFLKGSIVASQKVPEVLQDVAGLARVSLSAAPAGDAARRVIRDVLAWFSETGQRIEADAGLAEDLVPHLEQVPGGEAGQRLWLRSAILAGMVLKPKCSTWSLGIGPQGVLLASRRDQKQRMLTEAAP